MEFGRFCHFIFDLSGFLQQNGIRIGFAEKTSQINS
jgi:hypothetical protein